MWPLGSGFNWRAGGTMGNEVTRAALYWEIRRKGQPINPLPWLAVRKGKVSG